MDVCLPVEKSQTFYSQQHLWFLPVRQQQLMLGITEFYQDQLSDVLFVNFMVAAGEALAANTVICTLESAKALIEIQLPFSATLQQINSGILAEPALINQQPESAGWLVLMEAGKTVWQKNLLTAEQYQRYLDQ